MNRSLEGSTWNRSCVRGQEFITHYWGTAEGGDEAVTEHNCDYCGESFATSNELGGHVTAVHRRDQIVTDVDVILNDIQRVADKLGKPPTAKEMSEHGEYSQRVCQNKFGSWNEALREAGFAPNRKYRLTDQDLLDEINRLTDQFGRPPSSGEMNRIGKFHKCTYLERFGGWEEALTEAGFSQPQSYQERSAIPYGPNWPEQRQKALKRDDYECQTPWCGMTQVDHQEQVGKDISVHHLVPRKFFVDPDGRFDHEQANRVSNLVTVCSKHHLIWEAVAPQRLDTIVDSTQPQEIAGGECVGLPPRGGEG